MLVAWVLAQAFRIPDGRKGLPAVQHGHDFAHAQILDVRARAVVRGRHGNGIGIGALVPPVAEHDTWRKSTHQPRASPHTCTARLCLDRYVGRVEIQVLLITYLAPSSASHQPPPLPAPHSQPPARSPAASPPARRPSRPSRDGRMTATKSPHVRYRSAWRKRSRWRSWAGGWRTWYRAVRSSYGEALELELVIEERIGSPRCRMRGRVDERADGWDDGSGGDGGGGWW